MGYLKVISPMIISGFRPLFLPRIFPGMLGLLHMCILVLFIPLHTTSEGLQLVMGLIVMLFFVSKTIFPIVHALKVERAIASRSKLMLTTESLRLTIVSASVFLSATFSYPFLVVS